MPEKTSNVSPFSISDLIESKNMSENKLNPIESQGKNRYKANQQSGFTNSKQSLSKQEQMSAQQLQILFQFYDEYGPKWSNFQSLLQGKNQNLLKNKFHSTIRTLCRLILIASEQNGKGKVQISSSSISSKILVNIYQGKKQFRKYRNVMKNMLKAMKYDLTNENQNFEKCVQSLGVDVFRKIYDDIACVLGIKAKQIPIKQKPTSKAPSIYSIKYQEIDDKFATQVKTRSNNQNQAIKIPIPSSSFNFSGVAVKKQHIQTPNQVETGNKKTDGEMEQIMQINNTNFAHNYLYNQQMGYYWPFMANSNFSYYNPMVQHNSQNNISQ